MFVFCFFAFHGQNKQIRSFFFLGEPTALQSAFCFIWPLKEKLIKNKNRKKYCSNTISNYMTRKLLLLREIQSSDILRRPQKFGPTSPLFLHYLVASNYIWKMGQIFRPSQHIWTLKAWDLKTGKSLLSVKNKKCFSLLLLFKNYCWDLTPLLHFIILQKVDWIFPSQLLGEVFF